MKKGLRTAGMIVGCGIVWTVLSMIVLDHRKPDPDRTLRGLLDDAPIYSTTFWIENKDGVVYEIHATAVRTNEQAKIKAKK